MELNLSTRTRNLHASPIRDILAVIERPGMISFAGGLPAAETFPNLALTQVPSQYLQYGASEGEPVLRECIAQRMCALGLPCSAEQVLILSGSQQGIDLVSKLCIDEGTPVAVESPTYLAALQAFRFFGAGFVTFHAQHVDAQQLRASGARLLYTIPTFQNPTGHCYSAEQRQRLAHACDAAQVTLFEDDPYRDLVYDACEREPVCARIKHAQWIYQGSFSKSFAPGLRLGFLVASPTLMPYLVRLKQAADLHSNRLSQWLVWQLLTDPDCEARLAALAVSYRAKRDAFARTLQECFRELADWEVPPGGLFFWLRLKRSVDTRRLLPDAIARGVAFMPGEAFYVDPESGVGTLRLNFSHANSEQSERGLRLLAQLLLNTHR